MDKHTYIGKRKVGSTDIVDFTDYQGIGHDPLYKRYESVNSIIRKAIKPDYAHFLAAPDYVITDDTINWYINEWVETPERLKSLDGEKLLKYTKIKDETISHYKSVINGLSGEELQVMACVLRYIDDEFIYCCDDKVYVLAWGMTPDKNKVISKGELVHEAPYLKKHKITFNPGEHGEFVSKLGANISLPEDTEISENDIPIINCFEGYEFSGWNPNPIGMKVMSDLAFTATYSKIKQEKLPPPLPIMFKCQFDAGDNGILQGESIVYKQDGERLQSCEIPLITPNKGYTFKGWNVNPSSMMIAEDVVFNAIYEKKLPWYKKLWLWLTGKGCLKWLLWLLLGLLLSSLILWLLQGCNGCTSGLLGCTSGLNGVAPIKKIVTADGDTIDDNGVATPIVIDNGQLPDAPSIVAPIRDENGTPIPIEREPGVPPIVANRLFLFLEDENDDIELFAVDFKNAYPEERYCIIGFDRQVKSLLIQVPENERDEIRSTINDKIPNHKFIVFDEEIYELNGRGFSETSNDPGWHISAVKAREGWRITRGDPSIIVAVIDDGIDASHPIFDDKIIKAYNVFTQNNQLGIGDGHGTHTAGLAVGSLEFLEKGSAGIAPDCKLMPVQVFDNKMCPLSALISGIMYAVHNDADVVNVSIGPSFNGLNQFPVDVQDQIAKTQFKNVEKLWQRVCRLATNKNSIIVFAAGNDDILSSIPPENRTESAIVVGAVDKRLYPTDFTNYGAISTDISAPGTDIYSSFPVKNFMSCDGTSMSAPIVSGTIALMKSIKRDITVQQAKNVLYRTGADVYGNMPPMVQVNLALEAVKNGDFNEPVQRALKPVPEFDLTQDDIPSSWVDPGQVDAATGAVILPLPIDESIGNVGDDRGSAGDRTNKDELIVGDGRDGSYPINETLPHPQKPTPVKENESDYEAIRRLIKIYKEKIVEWESQLPENKKQ